jgi:hypothetical protein
MSAAKFPRWEQRVVYHSADLAALAVNLGSHAFDLATD